MNWLGRVRQHIDAFDLLSLSLIVLLTGLALTYWHKFPVHMDTYYHLGVTAGYARAGGVALHSFWEYAPLGRAQLYPPLLHIVMFALNKTGLSMVSVGRVVAFGAFPLLMLSGWYGMRSLFSRRAAFYCVVLLSSVYLLFWHSAVESAASLVLILTPLIFVAVDRNRKVAAAILLALALYSHLTLGHLVAFALLIYAVHRREMFKEILLVLAGAYLLWLPWGIQILLHRTALSFSDPTGGVAGGATVHILIWAVAIAGFIYCYFRKDKYYLLPSFLLGFVPIVFFYPDRFWNAHVFLPLAMLGGAALSALHGLVRERAARLVRNGTARKVAVAAVMAVPIAVFLLVDPVYATSGTSRGLQQGVGGPAAQLRAAGTQQQTQQQQGQVPSQPPNGVPGNQGTTDGQGGTGAPPGAPGANGFGQGGAGGPGGQGAAGGLQTSPTTLISLLNRSGGRGQQSLGGTSAIDSDMIKLTGLIKANSSADQIVYCSDGSLGNLITGLTGRASTGGMFHEVSPTGSAGSGSSYQNAYLLVLTGQGGMQQGPGQQGSGNIDATKYKLVGKAGSYSVYRNAAATAKAKKSGTVIPWFAVFSLLGLALGAACIDWFRPGPGSPSAPDDALPAGPGQDSTGDGNADASTGVAGPGVADSRDSESGGSGSQDADGEAADSWGTGERRDVLAIVPCYNEAGNVTSVVDELKAFAPFLDVLVVDDGSTDATAAVAREAGAIVVSHRENLGIGAAVRRGMACALEAGYGFAVQVDGDGQHDPRDIESLMEPLRSGTADMVVGSRFLGAGGYRPPLGRRLGIRLLASAVSLAAGRRATDTTSGFRAMNRRALAFLVANYPDDYAESESLVLMDIAGIRWDEAPVSMRCRVNGESSIKGFVSAYYMAKVLACIALDTLGFKAPRPPLYA